MRETVTKTIAANLFRGIEAVGGHLDIYESGLLFRPHGVNFQTQEEFISYEHVLQVQPCMTWGFIPNGLKVVTQQTSYHFVVWRRKHIAAAIMTQLQKFKENL